MAETVTNNDQNKTNARYDSASEGTTSVSGPFKKPKYESNLSIESNEVRISTFNCQ